MAVVLSASADQHRRWRWNLELVMTTALTSLGWYTLVLSDNNFHLESTDWNMVYGQGLGWQFPRLSTVIYLPRNSLHMLIWNGFFIEATSSLAMPKPHTCTSQFKKMSLLVLPKLHISHLTAKIKIRVPLDQAYFEGSTVAREVICFPLHLTTNWN